MAARGEDFFSILTAAINDIAEHGFDSAERVARWQEALRRAAEATLAPQHVVEDALHHAMQDIYRRMVERHGLLKYHPGVPRWTIEKLKPRLRLELDKRILASADLIKLNRQQSMAHTLRRFSGWATSVPEGGVDEVGRIKLKDEIRKPLARLPFEERRVAVDQGHKLLNSLNTIVAEDQKAIAGIWHSHWRQQANYDYRPAHKERDGKVYLVRDSWAQQKGFVKPGPAGYADEITQPGEEVNCLPGDTGIPFADGVEKAYRRWYSGQLALVVTDSGKSLRATPNHPILTPHGWVAMGLLNEGDYVVEIADDGIDPIMTKPYHHGAIPSIAHIFGSLNEPGRVRRTRGSREQFHGDGAEGNVDIVDAARPLRFDRESLGLKCSEDLSLPEPLLGRAALCAREFFGGLYGCIATPLVGRLSKAAASVFAFARHPDRVCCAAATNGATNQFDSVNDHISFDAKFTGKSEHALASVMALTKILAIKRNAAPLCDRASEIDQAGIVPMPKDALAHTKDAGNLRNGFPFRTKMSRVIKIERHHFSGHVYNLQTVNGWYVAEGIITHNCRCFWTWIYALRSLPDDMLTIKGRETLAQTKVA